MQRDWKRDPVWQFIGVIISVANIPISLVVVFNGASPDFKAFLCVWLTLWLLICLYIINNATFTTLVVVAAVLSALVLWVPFVLWWILAGIVLLFVLIIFVVIWICISFAVSSRIDNAERAKKRKEEAIEQVKALKYPFISSADTADCISLIPHIPRRATRNILLEGYQAPKIQKSTRDLETIEVRGRTVEDAIVKALLLLEREISEISFVVLQQPVPGRIFGIGRKNARIKVTTESRLR